MERSKTIFGNEISKRDYKKACKTQKKFIRKFGDDRNVQYKLALIDNPVLTEPLGVKTIVIDKSENHTPFADALPKNPIIIGNIRMGFGHYRISMAIASAAKSLGYTPLWFDLNSFPETTCTKIISYQNNLYSMGSRLSQKFSLFNKLFWEPMNYEGFKKLSYNASDQKTAELMTSLFAEIPKGIPFVATHVWPAQAAIHAGMKNVINAIPDNWPMALHLSEGALHTVQTHNAYWGYRNLRGFDGDKILNSMKSGDIVYTGSYLDDELVKNLQNDSERRLRRIEKNQPVRFVLTIGGAGAQGEFYAKIIETLIPYVRQNRATIYINCGDYFNVWTNLQKTIPELTELATTHFDNWNETKTFAENLLNENSDARCEGVHVFCNKDIFAAVYATNLLMRACDVLVTKPSELAFYPVPKLLIRRIGGHEMWGAIHSAEIGDGTPECSTPEYAKQVAKDFIEKPELLRRMIQCIIDANKIGNYDGAYNVIKLAGGKK